MDGRLQGPVAMVPRSKHQSRWMCHLISSLQRPVKIGESRRALCDGEEAAKQKNNRWEMLTLEEALASLGKGMHPLPSVEDIACILQKCRKKKNLGHALHLHAYIRERGLESHTLLGNPLVSTLVDVGSMCHAQQVFDMLEYQDDSAWNSLIIGYVKLGESLHALTLYRKMQEDDSLHPSGCTFVALLKACGRLKDLERGGKIHADIARMGLLETDVFVGSTLVDMYAKCGSLGKAHDVFDNLPVRNVVSWNALITGYVENGHGEQALDNFERMQYEGISPSVVTYVCILKACVSIGATVQGGAIYAEIARKGLEGNLFIGSILVDMYAKSGWLAEAQEVFDKLPVRDMVSWTALIAGYTEHRRAEKALDSFEQMQHEGISPGAVTFACSLKACGSIGSSHKGRELHAEITKKGLERDPVIGSTLVDIYAKCGSLTDAQKVFDKLVIRDVVLWTALIAGYAEHRCCEEALICFKQMQHEGISPDAGTFICSLKACSSIGATVKGREIHAEVVRKGLERKLPIGNTMVDMYAKCGSLAEAQEVFDKLPARDVVSWTALLAGHAQLGKSENVFQIFDRMIGEDTKPNLVTFLIVLNACSHAGLVGKGQMYFEAISNDYGLVPTLEHYTCMVDLLGRAGHVDKAVVMIRKMPFHPGIAVWLTVLGACRKWGNVEIGRHAFEHAVRLDEKNFSAYICMFNIYADADMQEAANKVEVMRLEKQAWEKPGYGQWSDACGIVHSLLVGDIRKT